MNQEQNGYKPMSTEERLRKRKLANRLMDSLEQHIFICEGVCCIKKGNALEVITEFRDELIKNGLAEKVKLTEVKCFSRCADAGSMVVYPEGIWYQGVSMDDVKTIVREHLIGGEPVKDRIAYSRSDTGQFVRSSLFPLDEEFI